MNNIIFIGGIHGSGKGTVCKNISKQTNLITNIASELIKWNDISHQNNKKVNNINETQESNCYRRNKNHSRAIRGKR
jgi:adenylate kinase